ncbi:MAG: glutathione peroxidase [Planctomycetota bacterium]
MRTFTGVLSLAAVAILAGCESSEPAQPASSDDANIQTQAAPEAADPESPNVTNASYVLDHTLDDIDGNPTDLASFKGDVLLIVNVASRCGFTSQYAQLQELFEEHNDAGFQVLGFPANEFMGQEPGTNEEIKLFCTTNYNVTFPMFSKIVVKGSGTHPLYADLAAQPDPIGGEPGWNFTKFLVNRDGEVVARFGSRTSPTDPELVARLTSLLDAPRPGAS